MDTAQRRLQNIQSTLSGNLQWRQLLVLPDDSKVTVASLTDGTTKITVDDCNILDCRPLSYSIALTLSAVGTPYEVDNPVPKYTVLELLSPDRRPISIPDLWASIYTLWTLFHVQETIPIIFSSSVPNISEILDYVLLSGLGRKRLPSVNAQHSEDPEIFLSRATFWQSAGTGPQWGNARGWLRGDYAARASSFPSTQSFTRTPLVITAHPLRPPKPRPGECIYKRFCVPVEKMLAFHVMDAEDDAQMEAFHRWHNSPRVSKWWGENGTMEQHKTYVKKITEDPCVISVMMSYDGEPMGYLEVVWIKENHVATFVPEGAKDHDRGVHMLVGEERFRRQPFTQPWFRSTLHYAFLADPRTNRIVGEPNASNPAILKTSIDAGMYIQTNFDFPYKRSAMTYTHRERWFKDDLLL